MNEIISKVTPLTAALVWLAPKELRSSSANYKAVDYLLNGLLTSTLKTKNLQESHLLFSENFGNQFKVLILTELGRNSLDGLLKLLEGNKGSESSILVIDELDQFPELAKKFPKEWSSRLQLLS